MYTIVDIETTGGSPVSERITEVAIYKYNGSKVVDELVSLVNPERKIPYYITQLTGITNSMVADAPKFYEIAKKIIEITDNCIFVAHNVNFDYNFIKQEFKNLGYQFHRDKLCTVQLSRKIIPGHKSYSLGKLCKELNIELNGRHRAAGDALATIKLFQHLQTCSNSNIDFSTLPGVDKKDLHPNLDPGVITQLPEEAGVYYFYNDKNDLVYIGKSKNIKTRVLSHFRNTSSKKAIEMKSAIATIDCELTGSELVALLKESHEIKTDMPRYNRAQRRASSHYGLYYFYNTAGYLQFHIAANNKYETMPLISFSTNKTGKNYLQNLVQKHQLCQKLCGLYNTSGACFQYEIMECHGACIGKELPESYNLRAFKIIATHKYRHNSFYIIEKGRDDDELAVIMVDNGKYMGYGYICKDMDLCQRDLLADCIRSYPDNRDIQQILRLYLKKGRPIDLIPF